MVDNINHGDRNSNPYGRIVMSESVRANQQRLCRVCLRHTVAYGLCADCLHMQLLLMLRIAAVQVHQREVANHV